MNRKQLRRRLAMLSAVLWIGATAYYFRPSPELRQAYDKLELGMDSRRAYNIVRNAPAYAETMSVRPAGEWEESFVGKGGRVTLAFSRTEPERLATKSFDGSWSARLPYYLLRLRLQLPRENIRQLLPIVLLAITTVALLLDGITPSRRTRSSMQDPQRPAVRDHSPPT